MSVVELVPKPGVRAEVQESVVKVLRAALYKAEAGEYQSVVVIARTKTGWHEFASKTLNFSEMIGRLYVVAASWIAAYNEEQGE